jgi:hypothetical protein
MAIKRTFNGATIIKPGAYSKIVVENLTGFPLQPTGVVGIVGEAVGGEPHVLDFLSKEGIQDAKARYKEGPIADALELLANPSFDPRIPNGASQIVVYKTNAGTQSARALANDHGTPVTALNLTSKNWGDDENQLSVAVNAGAILDAHAFIGGSVAGPYTLAGAETLIVIANGVSYTFTNTLTGSTTAAALIAELNTPARWAPSKPVIAAAHNTTAIKITLDPTVVTGGQYDYGCLKINAASTIDTIVGITGEARGVKGSRIFTFTKGTFSETSLDLGGVKELQVKYVGAGTAATLDIQDVSGEKVLSTVITGTPADNLSIVLVDDQGRNKYTMKALADLINSHAAYEASAVGPNPLANAGLLDYVDDLEIMTVAATITKDMYEIESYINTFTTLANAAKVSNVERGLAIVASPVFFSGGSDGVSANSDFADGFEAFKEARINVVVPLISKDIGALTIDSINALAASHAAWGWSTTGKSERAGFISIEGSKTAFKDAAKAINSGYVSIVGQQVRVLDKFGNLNWKDPWALACILAGMRAGAEVGEPLTSKTINVNDVRVTDGSWQPRKDYAEMIEAGCTIVEPLDTGGFRCVLGNTTYVTDGSFVWNRESVVQAAGYVAYDLRFNLDLQFTGSKARTGTAEAIANFVKNRMSLYLDADIIVGDDDNEGIGYKNLSVVVQGNTALINVSITPVQGIDFILPTIYLADIRQSA